MVPLDHALFLERADATQAGGRGEPDAVGELDVGDAPFVLQLGQQTAVDFVKIGHLDAPVAAAALTQTRNE